MSERSDPGQRAFKISLVAAFLAVIGLGGRRSGREAEVSLTDLGLMGLATHRIGRMIAFERVAEPIREPFTETIPDHTGVESTVVARGRGWRWAVGELMSCPICVGTWTALGLSIGMLVAPGPTRLAIRVLGVAGLAELNHVAVERLEWGARAARRAAR